MTWPHFNVQNPGLRAAPNKSDPISSVSVAYEISRFRKNLLKLKFIHFHLSKTHKARIFHLNYEHFVPFGKKEGGSPDHQTILGTTNSPKKSHQLPLSASPLRFPRAFEGAVWGPQLRPQKAIPTKRAVINDFQLGMRCKVLKFMSILILFRHFSGVFFNAEVVKCFESSAC